MTLNEARALFTAAVQAVAPKALIPSRSSVRTADGLLEWLAAADVSAVLHRLSDTEKEDLVVILGGMLQERFLVRFRADASATTDPAASL